MVDLQDEADKPSQRERFEFEKQKFEAEHRLAIETSSRQAQAQRFERWKSPITLAIVGGLVSLIATIITSYLNNQQLHELEDRKLANTIRIEQQRSESELIKRFLEPEAEEQRLSNLRFLADTGLLPTLGERVGDYVRSNPEALPRSLPVQAPLPPMQAAPPSGHVLERPILDALVTAHAVMVTVEQHQNGTSSGRCGGFFIDANRVLTAAYCVPGSLASGDSGLGKLRISRGDPAKGALFEVSAVEIRGGKSSIDSVALITIADPPSDLPLLVSSRSEPQVGERLTLLYAPRPGEFVAAFDDACNVLAVNETEISYRCEATAGSGGGPVISMRTGELLAIHSYVDAAARHGLRLDRLDLR